MKRCVAIVMLVVVTSLLRLPGAVDARQDPGCEGIDTYVAALTAAGDQLEAAMPKEDTNLDNWTSEEFAAVSEAIAAAQESFATIEPPAIAEDYHALLLEQMIVVSQMFDSMATLGIFGAFIYIEQMGALDAELEAAARVVENACGVELVDDSGSATPTAAAEVSSNGFFTSVSGAGTDAVPVSGTPEPTGAERSQ